LRERNARVPFGSLKPGELIAGSHPLDCLVARAQMGRCRSIAFRQQTLS
jgi:hypothetical protein